MDLEKRIEVDLFVFCDSFEVLVCQETWNMVHWLHKIRHSTNRRGLCRRSDSVDCVWLFLSQWFRVAGDGTAGGAASPKRTMVYRRLGR